MSDPEVPKLECPEFKPSIPSHLIKDAPDAQRFLMERISVLIQQQKWQNEHLAQVHDYCKFVNGKLVKLEEFKNSEEVRLEVREKSFKWKKYFVLLMLVVGYPVYLEVGRGLGIVELFTTLFGGL